MKAFGGVIVLFGSWIANHDLATGVFFLVFAMYFIGDSLVADAPCEDFTDWLFGR